MEQGGEEQGRIIIFSEDLVWEILSRLPVKSLLRFRCVCKSWSDLIRNPLFIRKHLQRTTENNNPLLILTAVEVPNGYRVCYTVDTGFPRRAKKLDFPFKSYLEFNREVILVGSCNGLVCLTFTPLGGQIGWDVCLWNPANGEAKFLPVSGFTSNCVLNRVLTGFSFDSINDEYKVVRVVYFLDYNRNIKTDVRVYTLGSDEWRSLGDIPYYIDDMTTGATIVNGIPHWMGSLDFGRVGRSELLIRFDGAREVFEEMPQPNYFADTGENETFMECKWVAVLGGCLSVFCSFKDGSIVIWAMKDYGLKESWTKQFVLGSRPATKYLGKNTKPLGFWSGGGILFQKNCRSLVLYDTKRNSLTELGIHGLLLKLIYQVFYHIESLVSLSVPSQRNMN